MLLIDAVKLTRLATVRVALGARVAELAEAGEICRPAMLVAAQSIEDLRLRSNGGQPPVAFEDFGPGADISATPGSEGFIGNLIRDAVRSGRWLSPTATLDDLRSSRCRSIVLLTDFAGSGTQLWQYATTLVRHPTIRSWRSGGFLKIHALAFVSTSAASQRLGGKGSPIDDFWTIEAAPTFDDRPWTTSQRLAVEDLCLRYARGRRRDALGYRESRGLFATDTYAPNNLPFVLRKVASGWQPFFTGREVPPDIPAELGDYSPGVDAAGLVAATRQQRLALSASARTTRVAITDLLHVLALLQRRNQSSVQLAAATGRRVDWIERLLLSLERLGMIDSDNRLTDAGREEIAAAKRAPRRVKAGMLVRNEPYYPATMR
jgi:hypothetical protein